MNDLQKLPADEKIEACRELKETATIYTKEDPEKIYNSCLNLITQEGELNEKLCLEFSDKIANLKKEECLSKIAEIDGNLNPCKFSQKNECIVLAGIKILKKYGELECNSILDKEKKKFCTNLKFGIKYGLLNSFEEITDGTEKEMVKNEVFKLSYFGSIENLCLNFEKDVKNSNKEGGENTYNNCIYAYMEVNSDLNPNNCQKLRLQQIKNLSITNREYCTIAAIIEGKGNLQDCTQVSDVKKCITAVKYISLEKGNRVNCGQLNDLNYQAFCISTNINDYKKTSNLGLSNNKCTIKGNISFQAGEKIYHTERCEYYSRTIINSEYGERWFCTEKEAINAGWRKAKNCY